MTLTGIGKRVREAATDNSYFKHNLEEALAKGEAALASQQFQWISASLEAACARASIDEIAREIAVLLVAFPGKDDLSAFVEIAVADIAGEHPSRLTVAAACRRLRRTAKFRPSISEMLETLSEMSDELALVVEPIRARPDHVEAVRQRIAKGDFQQPVEARITAIRR